MTDNQPNNTAIMIPVRRTPVASQSRTQATSPTSTSTTEVANIPISSRLVLNCSEEEMETHLDKLLECPICFELILPPINSCVEGHCWCNACHTSLQRCPVCRGPFSGVRNLFLEHFLDKYQFRCKYFTAGCNVVLPAIELIQHYTTTCQFRPIFCQECCVFVPYDDYLDHLRNQDKIQQQKASECSTGFEIDEDDLNWTPNNHARAAVWEPTWMNCYGENFLTFLEFNGHAWWIWVASHSDEGCKYRCHVILWNKELKSEISYKGAIHPVHSKPVEVMMSGECLILATPALRKFVYRRGIDVLVRIERDYDPPKTRRGQEVQSPLVIMRPGAGGAGDQADQFNVAPILATPSTSRIRLSNNPSTSIRIANPTEAVASTSTRTSEQPQVQIRVRSVGPNRASPRASPRAGPSSPPRPHQSRRLLFDSSLPSLRNSQNRSRQQSVDSGVGLEDTEASASVGMTSPIGQRIANAVASFSRRGQRPVQQGEEDVNVITITD